jgi:hypothetical protein
MNTEMGMQEALCPQKRIGGSLFFGETITAENFSYLLTRLITLLERDCWFQQDGAKSRYCDNNIGFLAGVLW